MFAVEKLIKPIPTTMKKAKMPSMKMLNSVIGIMTGSFRMSGPERITLNPPAIPKTDAITEHP